MPDREKVIKGLQECVLNGGLIGNCPYKGILSMLKKQETNLICNLLGGKPYEIYCKECRMVICRLGKGDDMNTVKGIFTYCPNCGRKVKWDA